MLKQRPNVRAVSRDRCEPCLIRRETCPDDARGQWIVVTDKGRALQEKMWKAHAPAIQRHVGDKLDDKPAAALGDLLGRPLT